jgi:hypothetical protein
MNRVIAVHHPAAAPPRALHWRAALRRAGELLHRCIVPAVPAEATALLARADRYESTQPGYAAELRDAAHRVIEKSLRHASAGGVQGRW